MRFEGQEPKQTAKEDTMRPNQLLSAVGMLLLVASSLAAQDKQGTLASIEFQKVKATNVPQYEAGRKQKAAWHKQQNDPIPLLVWQTLSGDNTGTFLVGHFNQHWADYDKPVVTDEADLAEFQKVLGNYVDSVTTRYYEYMPKVSNDTGDANALQVLGDHHLSSALWKGFGFSIGH